MADRPPPQHRGSLTPTPRDHMGHALRPGEDGWRTPTIEDANHPANLGSETNPWELHVYRHFDGLTHRRRSIQHLWRIREEMDDQPDSLSSHKSPSKRLPWRRRLKHVTWAWFTLTMATGGIANVISQVPYRFTGLRTIGLIYFLLNIVFYILLWAMIITRFVFYPYLFKPSFTHPTESLFVPAFAVSFGTILINIVQYGFGEVGEWLNRAVVILFWFDATLAIILSILIYFILWSKQTFTIARMTPIWIFPAYPLLIIGPHAGILSEKLSNPRDVIQVIVGGFTIQGIGFLVSLTIYSAFVYRLMTQKLPPEPLRPGMFVSVGPAAFTVAGTIGMAANLSRTLWRLRGHQFMDVNGELAAAVLRLVANWSSLWLWGLAWWFFFIALMSNLVCFQQKHRMPFSMTWFSFIFPQTALTTATFNIGMAFEVDAINVIGCVMTCLLILVWFVVVGMMIRAICQKQILWPEKGEDKSEGGFSMPKEKEGLQSHKGNENRTGADDNV